jgi:hypothetical protein
MKWIELHSPQRFVQEREETWYWYQSVIVSQTMILRNPLCHQHGLLGLVLMDHSMVEEHEGSDHIVCPTGNIPSLNIEHD